MTLDDILKLVQQLLTVYQGGKDRERIEVILENLYGMLMDNEDTQTDIIDFMDSIMFDVDYLIEHRREVAIEGDNEKENRKRRLKILDMFSEEY